MGEDEVRGLADGEDLRRLLVGDPDAVAVLELHHELDEVERIGLQVLLEARLLLDARGVRLELLREVRAYALEHLFPGHESVPTLAADADRKAPPASSAAAVR